MSNAHPQMKPREAAFDASAFSLAHPRPFLCDLAVADFELSGAIEHVSNVQYVRWLDRAAELHADSLGFTRRAMLDEGIMWFVARHEIDYVAEVWRGDQLVVATWVRDVRRAKSWRDYVIIRPADQTVVCRAATLWVLVDLAKRKPVRLRPDMLERFDALHGSASTLA